MSVSRNGHGLHAFGTFWGTVALMILLTMTVQPGAIGSIEQAELWVARYKGPGQGYDIARAIASTPDGSRVFVTGLSLGIGTFYDYATVAYDAASGARLWASRYSGPGSNDDSAASIAASPDGSRVFVSGYTTGSGSGHDYATLAYDSATGAKLWLKFYNGPGNGADSASSIAASPDGSKVFVTGESLGVGTTNDYATIAYDASTGARIWVKRYDGPIHGLDSANSLAVSTDGSTVFTTGSSQGGPNNMDYVTVAYAASSGQTLWVQRYNGPGNLDDSAASIVASSDGTRVFVTGDTDEIGRGTDYGTIAYDAATGDKLWARRYNNVSQPCCDLAYSVAASADSSKVFVTGYSFDSIAPVTDYLTVAYDALTGGTLWMMRYNGPNMRNSEAFAVAAGPDPSKVFVTGWSVDSCGDYATVAYDVSSGAELWVRRYNGSKDKDDTPSSLVLAPDGSRVFVTGGSIGKMRQYDYATVAYAAAGGRTPRGTGQTAGVPLVEPCI